LRASVLAGVQGLAKDSRRKLLNDALIFLSAHDAGAVLLQLRPEVRVLFYEQV
jgi:hypothetical protein